MPGVERVQALIVQPINGQGTHREFSITTLLCAAHLANERLALGLGHVNADGTLVAVTRGEVAGVRGVCALRMLQER